MPTANDPDASATNAISKEATHLQSLRARIQEHRQINTQIPVSSPPPLEPDIFDMDSS
jgi:hypothetical protein